METALATTNGIRQQQALVPTIDPKAIETALAIGDLSKMAPEQRVAYYLGTCASVGLNPYTKPFDAIKGDDGSVHLYPNKSAAEQLRRTYSVSLRTLRRERIDGLYVVTVLATLPSGRQEESVGAVPIESPVGEWKTSQNGKRYFQATTDKEGRKLYEPLRGVDLANALKKAETQAKRRATLGICGLGFLDAPEGGEAIEVELGNPPALASQIEGERAKPMQEHIADGWGDAPPVAIQQETLSDDTDDDIPDFATKEATQEPQAEPWLQEAMGIVALLREALEDGKLPTTGIDILRGAEELIATPDAFTQGQRTMRLEKARRLCEAKLPF